MHLKLITLIATWGRDYKGGWVNTGRPTRRPLQNSLREEKVKAWSRIMGQTNGKDWDEFEGRVDRIC